ncbi:hypothetical protein MMC30_006433 [Trapelia coarctata]|nr:hypothetical protein [Trapelia coarctata]
MSAQNFVFPPPPLPPPNLGLQISTSSFHSPNQQGFGFNGLANPRDYGGRGRGGARGGGDLSRGSRGGRGRGGAGYGGFSNPHGYQSNINGGYGSQYGPYSNGTRNPQASYPQAQQTQHGGQGQYEYGPPGPLYLQRGGGNVSQSNSGQHSGYKDSIANTTPTAYVSTPMGQEKEHMDKEGPVLMGPPIRMGFDNRLLINTGQTSNLSFQNTLHQGRGRPASFGRGGRDSKREHGEAFGSGRNIHARPMAPPAVPAFGAPAVGTPSVAPEAGQKPKKKKRKHNQLGLTPKSEEHESSEEEDIDEESKLAAMQLSSSNLALQFTYKGQLATLNSPSDIAAWIEERKKRFPTKKRAEEAAERKEQQKKAAQEARELKKKEWKKTKASEVKKRTGSDEAALAKMKAEKLRKQYEKAQNRVAEIEAKAKETESPVHAGQESSSKSNPSVFGEYRSSRHASEQHSVHSLIDNDRRLSLEGPEKPHAGIAPLEGSPSMVPISVESLAEPQKDILPDPDSFEPTSQMLTSASKENTSFSEDLPVVGAGSLGQLSHGLQADSQNILSGATGLLKELGDSISTGSSDLSFSDDDSYTSSSGSSSEESSPLETTSKRNGPERVPPSRSRKSQAICNAFLAKGRCLRGDKCKYRHELPERGSGSMAKDRRKPSGREGEEPRVERLSLYQRMLAQQQQGDDEQLMQHIIYLGGHGVLDEG